MAKPRLGRGTKTKKTTSNQVLVSSFSVTSCLPHYFWNIVCALEKGDKIVNFTVTKDNFIIQSDLRRLSELFNPIHAVFPFFHVSNLNILFRVKKVYVLLELIGKKLNSWKFHLWFDSIYQFSLRLQHDLEIWLQSLSLEWIYVSQA